MGIYWVPPWFFGDGMMGTMGSRVELQHSQYSLKHGSVGTERYGFCPNLGSQI